MHGWQKIVVPARYDLGSRKESGGGGRPSKLTVCSPDADPTPGPSSSNPRLGPFSRSVTGLDRFLSKRRDTDRPSWHRRAARDRGGARGWLVGASGGRCRFGERLHAGFCPPGRRGCPRDCPGLEIRVRQWGREAASASTRARHPVQMAKPRRPKRAGPRLPRWLLPALLVTLLVGGAGYAAYYALFRAERDGNTLTNEQSLEFSRLAG